VNALQDVKKLLEEVKASPYEEIEIVAPHTGVVEFVLKEPGARVVGPSGTWGEKPGTLLATIERERNRKPLNASLKGVVKSVEQDLAGKFVQAGQPLMVIRHFLSKDEVVALILKKTLELFHAPERAKYYFVPEVDKKVKVSGKRSVRVHDGMDLFIVSRMKRETTLAYTGPEGIIYSIYFQHNDNVDAGQPLIGVCSEAQTDLIQEVVGRVQSEWVEQE
jgi:biotin carboxyl carrier protein